jgi:glycosyltransferase involved in cell wall biosynthesis
VVVLKTVFDLTCYAPYAPFPSLRGTKVESLPVFLSVVFVVRNQAGRLEQVLSDATNAISSVVTDYELIVIDNASNDDSVSLLRRVAGEGGLPNLQVYALTKEVDADTASWVGLENALGDFVAVIDPWEDDIGFLPKMLDQSVCGADIVFASNDQKPSQGFVYLMAHSFFNGFYKWLSGVNLANEAPRFRVFSRRVVNFLLQHPQPAITYRHLPSTGGFVRAYLTYSGLPKTFRRKSLREAIDRGIRLLVSTTRAPMRLVTLLSLFGAIANLLYSAYVVAVAILKSDVAPGWTSLSLQQSGMFFLISLVLLVLGEYLMQMASLSNEGPLYYIGQEFTSAHMTRRHRLNVEELKPADPGTELHRSQPAN